jgi:hypothetical protein
MTARSRACHAGVGLRGDVPDRTPVQLSHPHSSGVVLADGFHGLSLCRRPIRIHQPVDPLAQDRAERLEHRRQARSENSTTAAMSADVKGRMVGRMIAIMATGSVACTPNHHGPDLNHQGTLVVSRRGVLTPATAWR